MLAVTFPKEMFKYLDHLLPPLFGVMVSGLSDYIKTSINETEDAETVTDEDGEVLGFEQMISSMFLVVTHLVQNPKNKPLRKAIGAQASCKKYSIFFPPLHSTGIHLPRGS